MISPENNTPRDMLLVAFCSTCPIFSFKQKNEVHHLIYCPGCSKYVKLHKNLLQTHKHYEPPDLANFSNKCILRCNAYLWHVFLCKCGYHIFMSLQQILIKLYRFT